MRTRVCWATMAMIAATLRAPADEGGVSTGKFSVSAAPVNVDDDGHWRPGATIGCKGQEWRWVTSTGTLHQSVVLKADAEANVTAGGADADYLSWATLKLVGRLHRYEMAEVPTGSLTSQQGADETTKWDIGSCDAGLELRAETDQEVKAANAVASCLIEYLSPQNETGWWTFSGGYAYDFVHPLAAEAREDAGTTDEVFMRSRFYAFWPLYPDVVLSCPWLHHTRLTLNYQYFREHGSNGVRADGGKAEYQLFDARIHQWVHKSLWRIPVQDVFVGFASGRDQPDQEDDQRLILGATLLGGGW
jgi:hypothetical protein